MNEDLCCEQGNPLCCEQSDPLGQFLADCVEVTDNDWDRVNCYQMYQLYEVWCHANGEHVRKVAEFRLAMLDRGFRRRKISTNYWLGMQLTRCFCNFRSEKK